MTEDVEISCPDCAASAKSRELTHEDGCPAAAALDEMSDQDRLWFEAHPSATDYFRKLVPGDLGVASLQAFNIDGKVQVVQLEPGVRSRMLPPIGLRVDVLKGLSLSAAHFLAVRSQASNLREEWRQRLGLD